MRREEEEEEEGQDATDSHPYVIDDVTEQILTDAVTAMSLREDIHIDTTRNASSIAAGIPQLPRGNSTMVEDLLHL